MEKKEFLERSKNLQQDEGKEYAENQGLKIGHMVFAFLILFLSIFSFLLKNLELLVH